MKKFILLFLLQITSTMSYCQEMRFVYKIPNDPKYNQVYNELKYNRCVEVLAQYMNITFKFQRNVVIIFSDEKDEANALSFGNGKIEVYYKLIEKLLENTPDLNTNKVANSIGFIVLHELGHELIKQFNLPVTGKEENAVDEFAIIQLLNNSNDERMFHMALSGTFNWYSWAKSEQNNFADEHAPNKERFYDMLALVYSKRLNNAYVTNDENDDFLLPIARAKRAIYDYPKKKENWDRLLFKYLKVNNTTQKNIPSRSPTPKSDDGW